MSSSASFSELRWVTLSILGQRKDMAVIIHDTAIIAEIPDITRTEDRSFTSAYIQKATTRMGMMKIRIICILFVCPTLNVRPLARLKRCCNEIEKLMASWCATTCSAFGIVIGVEST